MLSTQTSHVPMLVPTPKRITDIDTDSTGTALSHSYITGAAS